MTTFEYLLDLAAQAALNTFKTSGAYFYEDRASGERIDVVCIEKTIEIVETDKSGETFVRTGKGFSVSRADIDRITAFRQELGRDTVKFPTPNGGDYVVKITDEATERFEITYRQPGEPVTPTKALHRINTVYSGRDNPTNG